MADEGKAEVLVQDPEGDEGDKEETDGPEGIEMLQIVRASGFDLEVEDESEREKGEEEKYGNGGDGDGIESGIQEWCGRNKEHGTRVLSKGKNDMVKVVMVLVVVEAAAGRRHNWVGRKGREGETQKVLFPPLFPTGGKEVGRVRKEEEVGRWL